MGIEHLLCRLDAISIPKNAVHLRAYRKTLVAWIEETLTELWMLRFPVATAPLTKPPKTKTKTTTKTKASSTVTPSKKSKRLAAKARAKQWAKNTYGKEGS